MELLKVSSQSNPSMVAGAVAGIIRTSGVAEVQAIGAGAVNQAVKAIAIAVSYLEGDGIKISFVPSFADLELENEQKITMIKFKIDSCKTDNE